MNQRGFATLEVILMVVVIGILASVAVPRFTDVTTKANTAKIQSDLTTIDTAIQMFYMEGGKSSELTALSVLVDKKYLQAEPTPPKGSAFTTESTTAQDIPDNSSYGFNEDNTRSVLTIGSNKLTSDKFGSPKKE